MIYFEHYFIEKVYKKAYRLFSERMFTRVVSRRAALRISHFDRRLNSDMSYRFNQKGSFLANYGPSLVGVLAIASAFTFYVTLPKSQPVEDHLEQHEEGGHFCQSQIKECRNCLNGN